MAYFANGSEGDFYEAAVCARCANYNDDPEQEGCPIWTIHLLYNYDQCDNATIKDIMNGLIPMQGIKHDLCSMWRPAKPEWEEHGEAYREWAGLKEKEQE